MRLALALAFGFAVGCSSSDDAPAAGTSKPDGGASTTNPGTTGSSGGQTTTDPPPPTTTSPGTTLPTPGNPDGKCTVPAEAGLEDVTKPTTKIGDGTPASCTSDAVVGAIAKGGVITFDCGPDPVTITLGTTAKIFNDKGPIVIDGGNRVTLSGGKKIRILYMNACDKDLVWTSGDCNEQDTPKVSIQNMVFADGNVSGIADTDNAGGGAAIWARGGRLKIVNSRFTNNVGEDAGSDVAGGAVRVLDFPKNGSVNRPVYVVGSTFENNKCANGGGIGSIGTSYSVLNTLFTGNNATGTGASSGNGGNGGGIYNDGNTYNLNVCGSSFTTNHANAGGSAIFYVSNDGSGKIAVKDSVLKNNPKGDFETQHGMYIKTNAAPDLSGSTIDP